jgi:hypothetical protein
MVDLAGVDQAGYVMHRNEHDGKFFAVVGFGLGNPPRVARDDRGDAHRQQSGIGPQTP